MVNSSKEDGAGVEPADSYMALISYMELIPQEDSAGCVPDDLALGSCR